MLPSSNFMQLTNMNKYLTLIEMNNYNILTNFKGGDLMKDYTYFNSKLLTFHDENSEIVKTPNFVTRAAKNYRYDHSRQVLQKKCIDCGEYYDVQKFENGDFFDIHDESLIHYYSEESGYATRCVSCNTTVDKVTDKPCSEVDTLNTNVILTEDNLMYIKIVATLEKQSEQECLNDIIDIIRKYNTLKYEYNKKIK